MKAAVLYGKEDVRVENVTPAALKPGEVRIRIEAALTCGTDLKVFKRGYHAKMIVPPAAFGHELAGIICEVGTPLTPSLSPSDEARIPRKDISRVEPLNRRAVAGSAGTLAGEKFHGQLAGKGAGAPGFIERVAGRPGEGKTWRVGDRVVAANSAPCGACFHCQAGQENLCNDLLFLNGAYAESIVVPARIAQKNVLRLKSETEFRDAALVEPLACVVQGVEDTRLARGQHVLVLGAGPIGLMFVALATHLGCDVTVAGRRAARLRAARKLGANQVVDVGEGHDLVRKIRKATVNQFDAVIEAVGKPEVWEAAVHLVRKGGAVNFFGGCPSGTRITLDTTLIHYSNLTLLASFHHTPRTIRCALEIVEAGVVHAGDFVDGECSLAGLPELFRSMSAGNHAVKTLIHVRA